MGLNASHDKTTDLLAMQPPYPHRYALWPDSHRLSVADAKEHLLFAWYPADGEMGERSFSKADEIEWVDTTLRRNCRNLFISLSMTNIRLATGRFQLTITDWHRRWFVGSSAIDPQHQIKQSPNGDRIPSSNRCWQRRMALELTLKAMLVVISMMMSQQDGWPFMMHRICLKMNCTIGTICLQNGRIWIVRQPALSLDEKESNIRSIIKKKLSGNFVEVTSSINLK